MDEKSVSDLLTVSNLTLDAVKSTVGLDDVKSYMLGLTDSVDVTNYESYQRVLKTRHDLCHLLIANNTEMPIEEQKVQEFFDLSSDPEWHLVKNQTPDMIRVEGKHVKISEVTVSDNPMARDRKSIKYSVLVNLLKRNGFTVDFMIYVISLNPLRNNSMALDDDVISDINIIIRRSSQLLGKIHSTVEGSKWLKRHLESVDFRHENKILLTEEDVLKEYEKMVNKPFNSDEIESLLYSDYKSPDIEKHFEKVIKMVSYAKSGFMRIDDPVKSWEKMNEKQLSINGELTDDLPSILKIPYFNKTTSEGLKPTLLSNSIDSKILNGLATSKNMSMKEFTREQRLEIAREGPGRKAFVKAKVLQKEKDPRTGKNLDVRCNTDGVRTLINMIHDHGIELIHYNARVIQNIYRTIAILSTFKDHEDNFIGQVTQDGIKVVLFPGPRMRQSNAPSVIWFKLFFNGGSDIKAPFIRRLSSDETVCATKWISCDTQQIDNFIRAYDKLMMSSYSFSESMGDLNKTDESYLVNSFITLMEYKRCTSSYFQEYRYLMMNSCSINRNWDDVLERFDMPIRSTWQLYHWQKMRKFCERVKTENISKNFKIPSYNQDDPENEFSGAETKVPRMISEGDDIPFKAALCEMYFGMHYNKDQANPVHDELRILDKILWGERKFKETRDYNGPVYGNYMLPLQEHLMGFFKNDFPGAFSGEAIEIGSILQSNSKHCISPNGLAFDLAVNSPNLEKTLDEFATFKSSLHSASETYKGKDSVIKKKCVNEIMELTKSGDNLKTNFDVLNNNLDWKSDFVVFKKNQFGSVREILILTMKTRIIVNILETISRNLCKQDSREMLTEGSEKFTKMRDNSRLTFSMKSKAMNLFFNLDKSKWGPRLVPVQFLYMFMPFKDRLGKFWLVIVLILLKHHNKRCFLPSKLMDTFASNKNKDIQSTNPDLNALKDDFLKTGSTSFICESGMGQGILHYTSSYLHICFMSYLEELYKRVLKTNNMNPNSVQIMALLSSDDSQIWMSIFKSKNRSIMVKKVVLFLKCMSVAESLFNIKTGLGKSCISAVIQEFNSSFAAALGFYPTLVKFCLSSVPVCRTDSFYDSVGECFSSVRQLKDNGGSILLCEKAHELNKDFLDHVFRTDDTRSLVEGLGIRWENLPYHLGRYPNYKHISMYLFGPRYDSFMIYEKMNDLNDTERQMFINSHRLVSMSELESMSNLIDPEEVTNSLVTIQASLAPRKILKIMQKESGVTRDEIETYIMNNPQFLFRDPQDVKEVRLKSAMKLYSSGASKSVRMTSGVMYYARYVASKNSDSFRIGEGEVKTMRNCLIDIINMERKMVDDPYLNLLFKDFEEMRDSMAIESRLNPVYINRHPSSAMMIRSLAVTNRSRMMNNPASRIVDHFWFERPIPRKEQNQYKRDFEILKTIFPIKDTFYETLSMFQGDLKEKIRMICLLIMRIKTRTPEKIKMFAFGKSTGSVESTLATLIGKNYDPSKDVFRMELPESKSNRMSVPEFRTRYNLMILSLMQGDRKSAFRILNPTIDLIKESFRNIRLGLKHKRTLVCLSKSCGLIDSEEFHNMMSHLESPTLTYIQSQEFDEKSSSWDGPLVVECSLGRDSLLLDVGDGIPKLRFSKGILPRSKKILFDELQKNFPEELSKVLTEEGRGNFTIIEDEIATGKGSILATEDWITTSIKNEVQIDIGLNYLTYSTNVRSVKKVPLVMIAGDTIKIDLPEDLTIMGLHPNFINRWNLLNKSDVDTIHFSEIKEQLARNKSMPIPILTNSEMKFLTQDLQQADKLGTQEIEVMGGGVVFGDLDDEPTEIPDLNVFNIDEIIQKFEESEFEIPPEMQVEFDPTEWYMDDFEYDDDNGSMASKDDGEIKYDFNIIPSLNPVYIRNVKFEMLGKLLVGKNATWSAVSQQTTAIKKIASFIYLKGRLPLRLEEEESLTDILDEY